MKTTLTILILSCSIFCFSQDSSNTTSSLSILKSNVKTNLFDVRCKIGFEISYGATHISLFKKNMTLFQ